MKELGILYTLGCYFIQSSGLYEAAVTLASSSTKKNWVSPALLAQGHHGWRPPLAPLFLLGPLSRAGKCYGQALGREVEKVKDSRTRPEERIVKAVFMGIGERRYPAPKTSPPVWIKPSLPLKLFVSDWFSPQCSLRHVYLGRLGETTWLHHRPWRFSKIQPSRRVIFLCFLSCFCYRELRGVPETERNQPQPRVPTECHLSRHGVLGVSGNTLSPLARGGSVLVLLS